MKKTTVEQYHYDEFLEYFGIKNAIMTKWDNGEGVDIYIGRKNLPDLNISLTDTDIFLLRKMFSDLDF